MVEEQRKGLKACARIVVRFHSRKGFDRCLDILHGNFGDVATRERLKKALLEVWVKGR